MTIIRKQLEVCRISSNNDVLVTPTTSNPESFTFKNKSITNIYGNGTENIEIALSLKYFNNSVIFGLLLNSFS